MNKEGNKHKKIRVLMCENSLFMREKLKVLLIACNCEVVAETENGLDAIKAYQEFTPDLVTMDIVMPKKENLDGLDAMREILKLDNNAKVVMVTAMNQKKMIDECEAAGASGYLLKPVKQESVSRTLQEIFYG